MAATDNLNKQQFYHGTDARLGPGDLIEPGHPVVSGGSKAGHVYFTERYSHAEGIAKGAAERHATSYDKDAGQWVHGEPAAHHVYEVEPTGAWGQDQELPWTKYSHQSEHPLRVVRRVGE